MGRGNDKHLSQKLSKLGGPELNYRQSPIHSPGHSPAKDISTKPNSVKAMGRSKGHKESGHLSTGGEDPGVFLVLTYRVKVRDLNQLRSHFSSLGLT